MLYLLVNSGCSFILGATMGFVLGITLGGFH